MIQMRSELHLEFQLEQSMHAEIRPVNELELLNNHLHF
ncbi:hypothetical protein YERSI8AC_910005 [Enterobacterales bacterium 8AC]|nr:hypothetical protein YERSI8AC_910005 [Enterobacterales bacterium 8AC]